VSWTGGNESDGPSAGVFIRQDMRIRRTGLSRAAVEARVYRRNQFGATTGGKQLVTRIPRVATWIAQLARRSADSHMGRTGQLFTAPVPSWRNVRLRTMPTRRVYTREYRSRRCIVLQRPSPQPPCGIMFVTDPKSPNSDHMSTSPAASG
jgi:hypothetical protein